MTNNTYKLTLRELEVLSYIIKGKTNLEIAEILCVTKNTIKAYTQSIFYKMKVQNRVQAAVKCVIEGIAGG